MSQSEIFGIPINITATHKIAQYGGLANLSAGSGVLGDSTKKRVQKTLNFHSLSVDTSKNMFLYILKNTYRGSLHADNHHKTALRIYLHRL